MPRRKNRFSPGEYYHVYNRGSRRAKLFFERDNYAFFLRRLREHISAKVADVVAWCLMPNHYHLLLMLRNEALSEAMHSLAVSYAMAINKRFQLSGSLFEGTFKAILVDDESYLLHLTRYIHLNPKVAQLVLRPEDWEFSSYRDYVGKRSGNLASPDRILSEFAGRDAYRRFVEAPATLTLPDRLMIDSE